ncbi:hypothetical protein GCM10007173_06660 [Glutamicibacter ardleyensis]|uniref:Uncharacterized protein n=1 Tax=Glutamicibacter ardleyensis TaxID=225894 RepID=A0ABQ2DDL6_9MICC|nr:hypothetical protein GCM10007173_06660 [Glutamicibacter ardleyensis]
MCATSIVYPLYAVRHITAIENPNLTVWNYIETMLTSVLETKFEKARRRTRPWARSVAVKKSLASSALFVCRGAT